MSCLAVHAHTMLWSGQHAFKTPATFTGSTVSHTRIWLYQSITGHCLLINNHHIIYTHDRCDLLYTMNSYSPVYNLHCIIVPHTIIPLWCRSSHILAEGVVLSSPKIWHIKMMVPFQKTA